MKDMNLISSNDMFRELEVDLCKAHKRTSKIIKHSKDEYQIRTLREFRSTLNRWIDWLIIRQYI